MSGRIHMESVANAVFGEGSEAASQCKETLSVKRIPRIPVLVSEGAERNLLKKHKIALGNGIEISVPPELLQNQASFSGFCRTVADEILKQMPQNKSNQTLESIIFLL